jgi:hypothetical protein
MQENLSAWEDLKTIVCIESTREVQEQDMHQKIFLS